MDTALLVKSVAAIGPVLMLLCLFALLDVFRLMSLREVAVLVGAGMLVGAGAGEVNGFLIEATGVDFFTYSRFVAPVLEEAGKAMIIVGLFAGNRIGFKIDGAISGFAIGAGFACIENAFYLLLIGDADYGLWLVRGLGTAVMHGGATAVFAVITHEFLEMRIRGRWARWAFNVLEYLPGFAAAVAIHAAFNMTVDWRPVPVTAISLLVIPLTLFLVFWRNEAESRKWLRADLDKHRDMLEALQREGLNGVHGEALMEAIAERFHGRVQLGSVEEYVALELRLVLRAEETLHDVADGHAAQVTEEDRRMMARFHELRHELGRAVIAALRPSLPFSRNDLWELSEFEARFGKIKPARRG